MFRLLQAGSYIGMSKIKEIIFNQESKITGQLNKLGGVYGKFSQTNGIINGNNIDCYSKCQPINVEKTQQEAFKFFKQNNLTYVDVLGHGTIGMVFKVIDAEGGELAVKIKYHGIDQIVLNDLNALNKLNFKMFGMDTGNIVTVLRNCMKLELNYPLEIKNHELMNKIADENQNFKINIPAIHRSLSNVNIIVTDCISNSVNLLEWQETSPADNKKIEVINSLFDFLNFCVFKKNVLYADPHYGNILISEDSKIHIVDFGLIYSLTNEELQHFNLVVNSVQQDDYQAFKVTQEKNIIVPKEETFQFLWTYSKNIISPLFEDKLFLITEEQVSTLTQLVDTNVSSLNIKTNVSDLLFLKMYLNIMCIIAKFKVKINLYQYSKKYLDVVTSV